MQPIQVIVVTTSDLVRCGIHMLLHSTGPAVEVTESFDSLEACQRYLIRNRAHVLLLDDMLPGVTACARTIRLLRDANPCPRIIVLSSHLSEYYIELLMECGASGFIYKEDHLENTLVTGIGMVAEGRVFLSPQAAALPYGKAAECRLNMTDLELLQLLVRGLTIQEIAPHLGITIRSAYRIRSKLRDYLRVRTNEQVVEAALRHGLLDLRHLRLDDQG